MTDTIRTGAKQSFDLRSTHVSLTTLELYYFDDNDFETTLREKISQAPGFFRDIPLVISLEKYEGPDSELDFFRIIGTCRRHSIHVIGVRAGNDDQRRLARNASLAILPGSTRPARQEKAEESGDTQPVSDNTAASPAPARIVTHPVRSGQQIHAPEGDVVVLGPVQAGAEILAAGNIHVYGPLRGRALAGIRGNENAHIFCQSLEAELVSIAGHYKISEDLQENGWKRAVHIQLRDERLEATPLDKA